ncbi:MAG: hypothetical protein II774_10185 [Lachnospiraceae bacterium]|nr:hypothetical protein [Lachnospiraceae bacterium]
MMTRTESLYIGADEVAAACSVSKAKAYMIIRAENEKLKEQGYLTIAGKLPRRYFESLIAGGRSPGNGKETENVRG